MEKKNTYEGRRIELSSFVFFSDIVQGTDTANTVVNGLLYEQKYQISSEMSQVRVAYHHLTVAQFYPRIRVEPTYIRFPVVR